MGPLQDGWAQAEPESLQWPWAVAVSLSPSIWWRNHTEGVCRGRPCSKTQPRPSPKAGRRPRAPAHSSVVGRSEVRGLGRQRAGGRKTKPNRKRTISHERNTAKSKALPYVLERVSRNLTIKCAWSAFTQLLSVVPVTTSKPAPGGELSASQSTPGKELLIISTQRMRKKHLLIVFYGIVLHFTSIHRSLTLDKYIHYTYFKI